MMPSRGRKFITEFLLPNLNKGIFGTRLMWLDIEQKVFQIQWSHKSASAWTTSDAAVFAAWDKRKGHYKPDDKEYYPKSKQRFRAALYKFITQKHITELSSEDKYTKIYCIGDGKNISETYITAAKNEKENDANENSQKVKQKWNSMWNTSLLTEPQENYLEVPESQKESFVKEEVFTNCTDELVQEVMQQENMHLYDSSVISYIDMKSFSPQITSNMTREREDMKLVHVELHIWPDANTCKKDNNFKKVITIKTGNYQDYLCTDTFRQVDCTDYEFPVTDEDLSNSWPLPCI